MDAGKAAALALAGGVRLFQYRNKRGSRRAVFEVSLGLVRLLRGSGAVFIVNDHADIAAAVDADGVHLGQDDLPLEFARKLLGPGKLIGLSTHTLEQAEAAQAEGADYIGFGPVFPTATKDAGPARGIDELRRIHRAITIPLLAIGGITLKSVSDAMGAGADGVAVISAILSAPDIASASRELIREIGNTKTGRRVNEGG